MLGELCEDTAAEGSDEVWFAVTAKEDDEEPMLEEALVKAVDDGDVVVVAGPV